MRIIKILLFTLLIQQTNAQIGMANQDNYDKIKTGTLYVQMSDTASESSKKMLGAVRSAWTISKIIFVTASNMNHFLQPGNTFVTLEHTHNTFNFVRENTTAGVTRISRSEDVNNDYFFLHFWVLDMNYKEEKGLQEKNKITIARAELYLKSIGTGTIIFNCSDIGSTTFQSDFCNGLPGYIKNIFQHVNNNISNNITSKLKKDTDASPELAALQKDTLYVPNYWYGPGGTMLPDEPENSANGRYIRNMISDYVHPIKLIRRDELSNMILNTKKPVYYFNYIQSSADKMISVVNGLTGDILVYNFNDKSYRPKSKDFKWLSGVVDEAK